VCISSKYKLIKLRSSLCLGLIICTLATNATNATNTAADVEICAIDCEVNPKVIIDLNNSVPGVLGVALVDRYSLRDNDRFTGSERNHGNSRSRSFGIRLTSTKSDYQEPADRWKLSIFGSD
jgi:hypothetical protein